jgi:hypothetical protein
VSYGDDRILRVELGCTCNYSVFVWLVVVPGIQSEIQEQYTVLVLGTGDQNRGANFPLTDLDYSTVAKKLMTDGGE